MSDCTHERVVVTPAVVKNLDGKIFADDLDHGELHCMECREQLPTEDLHVYPQENVFVGIDKDIVDGTSK